jgi:hypothetical protein
MPLAPLTAFASPARAPGHHPFDRAAALPRGAEGIGHDSRWVQEAVENALSSVEKLLDEHETKKRAFVS